MNYRQVHTDYPRSEHRFDQMLGESLRLYDQGLYFLRQEYFRCRVLDWEQTPKYDSWFYMCSKAKECPSWSESNLDINIKKQTLKKRQKKKKQNLLSKKNLQKSKMLSKQEMLLEKLIMKSSLKQEKLTTKL